MARTTKRRFTNSSSARRMCCVRQSVGCRPRFQQGLWICSRCRARGDASWESAVLYGSPGGEVYANSKSDPTSVRVGSGKQTRVDPMPDLERGISGFSGLMPGRAFEVNRCRSRTASRPRRTNSASITPKPGPDMNGIVISHSSYSHSSLYRPSESPKMRIIHWRQYVSIFHKFDALRFGSPSVVSRPLNRCLAIRATSTLSYYAAR
jgi:hypothetical protein